LTQSLFESQPSSPSNSGSEEAILKWVTLLDVHFKRKEALSLPEKKIYISALRKFSVERLDPAFQRCMHECQFMPKIAEIESRMPEEYHGTAPTNIGADFVPVKDWYEPHLETHNLRVWIDRYGRKKVQQVVISAKRGVTNWPQHWPPKDCQPMTWDQAREKLKIIAKAKAL